VLLIVGLIVAVASPALTQLRVGKVRVFHIAGPINGVSVITQTAPFATNAIAFVPLPGAVGSMAISPGQRALIKVQLDAETQCTEADIDANWCSVRILIGGIEGNPASGIDFAFDSTNRGRDLPGSWQAGGMTRVRCIANTTGSTINVPVMVQVAVTNVPADASRPVFRLDDWELDIYRAQPCSQQTSG
jgi:hypothetical protein